MMVRPTRAAFSMLEILIALALGAFLMIAIFQAFYLAARYRNEIGNSQTASLSLFNAYRDIMNDLGNRVQGSIDATTEKSLDRFSSGGTVRERLTFRDSFASASRLDWVDWCVGDGYVGFRSHLWSPRFPNTPPDAFQADDCLIVWWLSHGSNLAVNGWRQENLLVSKTLVCPIGQKGLMRTMIYRDRSGQERQLTESIEPEVVGLSFDVVPLEQKMIKEIQPKDSAPNLQDVIPRTLSIHLMFRQQKWDWTFDVACANSSRVASEELLAKAKWRMP